jgi:hypothetical protein
MVSGAIHRHSLLPKGTVGKRLGLDVKVPDKASGLGAIHEDFNGETGKR